MYFQELHFAIVCGCKLHPTIRAYLILFHFFVEFKMHIRTASSTMSMTPNRHGIERKMSSFKLFYNAFFGSPSQCLRIYTIVFACSQHWWNSNNGLLQTNDTNREGKKHIQITWFFNIFPSRRSHFATAIATSTYESIRSGSRSTKTNPFVIHHALFIFLNLLYLVKRTTFQQFNQNK